MKIKKTHPLKFLTIGLLVFVAGCTFSVTPDEQQFMSFKKAAILDDVWRYLKSGDTVDDGYALYTYVLTSRSASDTAANSRYGKLVKLIQETTTAEKDIASNVDRSELNIFLIPAKGKTGKEQADLERAKSLLLQLSSAAKKRFSGNGPFLVSVDNPIGKERSNKDIDVLYADLSNIHEKAFPKLVSTYKDRIAQSEIRGVSKLSSFSVTLLNTTLFAEDSIGFIGVAEAGFRDAFIPGKE
ncbi:hypothetical protein [Methylomonas fluvii]|uniref:Lipoprotein n=1 Tax=Methylomonas fluvii TaxID=1854564 RepID=A0ABR9DEC1_9GAMM|nr:hypothetical protein [Methylomonas fluvii]MBD9360232.1 hypothetical protein [Methylomonas fluvii]